MNMIFFCEINKTGQEHIIINNCLLNILSKMYYLEKIHLWIDRSHYEYYKHKPKILKTIYRKVIRPEKSNKIRWIVKLISEIIMISNIVFSANKNKAKAVFFSSLSPTGNLYLSLIIPLVNSKIKFIVTLHSELELAKTTNWNKQIENIYGKALRISFSRNIKNRRFLILGYNIYNNILKYGFLKSDQMIFIEHPYIFPEITNEDIKLKQAYPITFGHLGVAKLNKQSQLFFKLAEMTKEYILNGLVRFVIVGQVFDDIKPYVNDYVFYEDTDSFIFRSDYEKKALELDYSIFFYNNEAYEFTSSGAIMDAIAFEKPIIGLKVKLLEDIFNKDLCTPGFLFDDFATMAQSIEQIIEQHNYKYDDLVNCIRQKKKLFSVEAQLLSFKYQMDQFSIL